MCAGLLLRLGVYGSPWPWYVVGRVEILAFFFSFFFLITAIRIVPDSV